MVKGFSHELQTRIENNHPDILPATDSSATHLKELEKAAKRFALLESEIDIELQSANSSEKQRLLAKKKEYQAEQEKIYALLSTEDPVGIPQRKPQRMSEKKPTTSNHQPTPPTKKKRTL